MMRKVIIVAGLILFMVIGRSHGQEKKFYDAPLVGVKTNAIYWLTTTINVGAEIGLGRKTTVDLLGTYNPWSFGDNKTAIPGAKTAIEAVSIQRRSMAVSRFPTFTGENSRFREAGRLLFHFELAQFFQDVLHGFFVNLRFLFFQPFHQFEVRIWSHNLSVSNFGGGGPAYRTFVVQVAGV